MRVFVNSGNANCFTGNQGIEDCESLVELVSKELNIPKGEIAISSTRVIGRKMPLDVITGVASKVFSSLETNRKIHWCKCHYDY